MKKEEFFNIGLPKWPAFVVVGKPVTREQAMEILIRTDSLCFSSNDREFDKELKETLYKIKIDQSGFESEKGPILELLGIKEESESITSWKQIWDYKDKCRDEAGAISLGYLNNNRIVSSWIGGPHGWCGWDGNIGCSNYNIGKWPSVEDVYNEWTLIARAFPFLELTCQLMQHEAGPDDGEDKPAIEFKIKSGKVTMKEPKKAIKATAFGTEDMVLRFSNPHAERGCTIEMFKEALEHTKQVIQFKQAIHDATKGITF
jgi:hypothetical protein